MTLHRPALLLSLRYLAIFMIISLFFSWSLYTISINEIGRGFRRLGPGHARLFEQDTGENFLVIRDQQLTDARQALIQRLILINLVILAIGGVLSYLLAVRTLRPLEEAAEAQQRFTADASHELKTPITAMRAEIETSLMDPNLNLTRAKKVLKSNVEELQKLTDLSNALLRLAASSTDNLRTEDVPVNSIVAGACAPFESAAKAQSMKFAKRLIATNGLSVQADPQLLTESIRILVDNAIKYSGAKKVEVATHIDNSTIRITVTDDGVGIRHTDQQRIFERFYRVDQSRTKQTVAGFGLGLSLAQQIVAAHNGNLTVSSQPSQGSTFTIELPR
jgi:signal transduction histidine kinase